MNLERKEARKIFKKLVETADIVIDSFPPGHMENLGLGYDDLCRVKSDIILTSITPFGQNGPYKDFQVSDLVCWSMGGFAFLTGDPDRPPVHVSFPQAFVVGSNEASAATMVALYCREASGVGQHVDVSIQASVAKNMMNAPLFWEAAGVNLGRAGPYRIGLSLSSGQRVIWKCKDGAVTFFFWGGKTGARTNRPLVEYMDEEAMAPAFMKEMDWENFDMATASEALFNDFSRHTGEFFKKHTKKELFQQAVERKMTLYPIQDAADISADPQLEARGFWKEVEYPELGRQILHLKPPAILSEEMKTTSTRAPLIGEHNEEVYVLELGFPKDRIKELKDRGAI